MNGWELALVIVGVILLLVIVVVLWILAPFFQQKK